MRQAEAGQLSSRGADVVETLERVTGISGTPRSIRVEQGPVISKDLDLRAYLNGVVLDCSRPGEPTDNAFAESFGGPGAGPSASTTSWFFEPGGGTIKM